MKNPLLKTDLFITPNDRDELLNIIKQYSGKDQMLAVFICNITWNLAAKKVDEAIAAESIPSEDLYDECATCKCKKRLIHGGSLICAKCLTPDLL